MAKPWTPPTGRISSVRRSFAEVVRDLRFCVFSVIRFRAEPPGQDARYRIGPIGSGFFVAPTVFLTCNHVMNGATTPHQTGDKYQLVRNTGTAVTAIAIPTVEIGQQLHLFPDYDAAIIQTPANNPQPYASVDYSRTVEGLEIGVAGYPLSQITTGSNGEPQFQGVVYRVAKGVVTSTIQQRLNPAPNPQTTVLSTVEVNFLFVPGNSGGPIVDAETGRVLASVHGFLNREIVQKFANTNAENIAAGADPKHVQSLHAVYSLGIKLENIRGELEKVGVTL
ncbi:MAG TPA: serine protease [Candidatus Sulfotelmatobacter sp.]